VLDDELTAYDVLLRRYERAARATCFGILQDWHAAQDAAQDAFITAYTNLRSLRDPGGFGTWLLTIARHRALRMRRSARPCVDVAFVPELAAAQMQSASVSGELFALIARLPEHERAVVMLRYVEGHSVEAIARICGRSLGTVTKQLSRAHQRLRRQLTKGDPS
jgi:RNA polymerase sigma-70 factor (ECF subfamily)